MNAGIGAHDDKHGQRDSQAGASNDEAEHECRNDDEQKSLDRKAADRSARFDERAGERDNPDQYQKGTENDGEVARTHFEGGAHAVVASDYDGGQSERDI